jgi:iron complex outermembrane receptor protein
MARALAAGTLSSGMLVDPFAAAWRRAYWRTYDGVTRLRASASHDVAHGLSLFVAGDNLLDRQGGDPDNATVVPGRTVTLGVRAKF